MPASFRQYHCLTYPFLGRAYADSSGLQSPLATGHWCGHQAWAALTLMFVVPVKHPVNLQDVAVAIVPTELVPRSIKAKDNLSGPTMSTGLLLPHDAWLSREAGRGEGWLVLRCSPGTKSRTRLLTSYVRTDARCEVGSIHSPRGSHIRKGARSRRSTATMQRGC